MLVPFTPAPSVYLSHQGQMALQKHVAQVGDVTLVASACLHHWGRCRVGFTRGKMSHRTYGFVECCVFCYHHVTSLMVRQCVPSASVQLRVASIHVVNRTHIRVETPHQEFPPAIGVTW